MSDVPYTFLEHFGALMFLSAISPNFELLPSKATHILVKNEDNGRLQRLQTTPDRSICDHLRSFLSLDIAQILQLQSCSLSALP